MTVTDNDVVAVTAVDDNSTTNATADTVATEALLAPQTDLLANDTDGLNNFVSAFDSTSAEGATVSVAADGTFTYDPIDSPSLQALPAGGSLADTFSYTAQDAIDNTDSATVTITVDGLNDAPEAMPDVLNNGPLASDSSFVSTRDLTRNDGSYRNNPVPLTFPAWKRPALVPGQDHHPVAERRCASRWRPPRARVRRQRHNLHPHPVEQQHRRSRLAGRFRPGGLA